MEKKAKNWLDEGSVPSEPFFVPRPGATEEDDGKRIYKLIWSYIFHKEIIVQILVFNKIWNKLYSCSSNISVLMDMQAW